MQSPGLSRPHSAHGFRRHRTFARTLAAAGGDNTTAAADPVAVLAVDALSVAADNAARTEDVGGRAGGVHGPDEHVGPGDGGHGVGVALCIAIGSRLALEVHVELIEPPHRVGAWASAEPLPHDPAAVEEVFADQRLLVVQVLPGNKLKQQYWDVTM